MSASESAVEHPTTSPGGVAVAAPLEAQGDTNTHVPVSESSVSLGAHAAELGGAIGGEKRSREEDLVGAETSNEEPPTKKAASEGEEQPPKTGGAEVTRNATEMQSSAAETTPQINGSTQAAPIGPSTPPVPFGPAAPDGQLDQHRWGADAGPFRHTLKVPQHC
ncbi:hypothetical protein FOZ63_022020, partial [Perkinsus olseni]